MPGFQDWLKITDPALLAESIAAQFRLSQSELEKALAALQPAFALGLERAMASPAAWSDAARALAAFVPGAGTATPAGTAMPGDSGRAFLDAFFGSDALTAAIARQASLLAGIAPDTLQKLMPGLALLSLETLMRRSMADVARNWPAGLARGDFGSATAEMLRRSANAVDALSRPSDAAARPAPNPFADVFGTTLKEGFAWMSPRPSSSGPGQAPAAGGPAPGTADPVPAFAALFEAFARGFQGPAVPAAAEPEAPGPPSADTPAFRRDGLADLLGTGQKWPADYTREMAALFERYGEPPKPN